MKIFNEKYSNLKLLSFEAKQTVNFLPHRPKTHMKNQTFEATLFGFPSATAYVEHLKK